MRNADATKAARHEHVHWYLGVDITRLVFVDETGVCLWTTRKYGRSLIGTTPRAVVSSQREANRSVAMANAMNRGVVCYKVCASTFNRDGFVDFLADLCAELHANGPESPIIVMDNCRTHSPADLEEISEEFGLGIGSFRLGVLCSTP